MTEADKRRVFREEIGHTLLEFCDLCKLAVVGLVLMDEEEERLGFGDILWLGRELGNSGLEDSTGICKNCQYENTYSDWPEDLLVTSLVAIRCLRYSMAKSSSSGNSFMPRSKILVAAGSL